MTTIQGKGDPAPKDYFTGTVFVKNLIGPEDQLNTVMGKVSFEPKARTNWHSHPHGQVLIVTDGIGYYQEKGKPIQLIRTGDVVKIPVNVEHWHGASKETSMTHTAMVPSATNGTIWLKPVSDADYNSLIGARQSAVRDISITETAEKTHRELWPDYESKAILTDPELIEVFDNFAFHEVLKNSSLDGKTRIMIIMASTIASQSLSEYKMMLSAALNQGATAVEIKEVLYQAVPYVGISKVIDFIYITNGILKEKGVSLPLAGQSTTSRDTRMSKGLAKQKEVVGSGVDDMYRNSPKDLLHIQEFLSANCFGDYITRNGLDIKTREMVTLSFLIALGGAEAQIKGHIRGNVNAGNDRKILIDLMTQLIPYVGYPRTLNAIACLNEVLPAS